MIRKNDRVSFAGSIEVRQRVKDPSELGYHFEIVSEPCQRKGKLGDLSGLSLRVTHQDGSSHPVPFKTLIWGEDDKTCFYPVKLPDKTEWQGEKLVVTKKGKPVDQFGTASLNGLFLPVILRDKSIAQVQYNNLQFVEAK
ncbi:unnamed protein product [marine sediment metagenome]|uniref:Uncharacterized protein n=1 Tax=marine sediment metagenome TaxID=412755 RepID=X1K6B5_9ZZZZ